MDDDWILYLVTSFTFAVIFIFCYIRHVFTFFERNKIPSATYATFPVGNMYDVVFQKTPMFMQLWKYYNRFKRKKYSVGGFYVFLKPAVLILNPTEKYLSTSNDYFVNEAKSNDFDFEISENLLTVVSEKVPKIWQKLLVPFQEKEQEVNFSDLMNGKFVQIATQHFFGIEMTQSLQELFHFLGRKNFVSTCRTMISLSYPALNSFFKNKLEKCHLLLEKVVEDRKKRNVKKEDLLQILIQSGCSTEELTKFIFLMLYNLKRCNNLLLFTLYELCINEDIQETLREEIIGFKEISSDINYSNINKLVYLDSVVCETLRKYPLEPFLYKICKKDFLENYTPFSKGLLVFISTFGIHHDAKNYVNPEQFNPDRFSEESKKFSGSTKYIPFGNKNESGFDAQYVKVMMKLTLIEFLSAFRFSLCKNSPKTLQFDETSFKSLKFKEHVWLKINRL